MWHANAFGLPTTGLGWHRDRMRQWVEKTIESNEIKLVSILSTIVFCTIWFAVNSWEIWSFCVRFKEKNLMKWNGIWGHGGGGAVPQSSSIRAGGVHCQTTLYTLQEATRASVTSGNIYMADFFFNYGKLPNFKFLTLIPSKLEEAKDRLFRHSLTDWLTDSSKF